MKSSSDPSVEEEDLARPMDPVSDFRHWSMPELERGFSSVEDVGVPSLPTAEELERIRAEAVEEGRRQGHAEGLAAGRAEGLEQARTEIERQENRLRGWLTSLAEPLAKLDGEVAHQLSRLALQVAAAVIRRELTIRPDAIEQIALEAIEALPRSEVTAIEIFCHPDDLDALRAAAGEGAWTLRPDPTVSVGGLIIESGDARVDASLEARWAQMSERLLAMSVPGPTEIPLSSVTETPTTDDNAQPQPPVDETPEGTS